MFVAKTNGAVPIYRAFGTSQAAHRWAEEEAYVEHEAEQCQIFRTISGLSSTQAIAAVKLGKVECLLIVHRGGDHDRSLIGPGIKPSPTE